MADLAPGDVKASVLPQDGADCGWYELLPAPTPPRLLRGEQQADWAVLGAGVTGLAAARRLAELRPNARIALIDAQRIGFGAAGRNSGFMIDLPHALTSESYTGKAEADRWLIALNRAAIAYVRDTVQRHGIDCDWSEQGKIHAAIEDGGVQALAAFRKGLDAVDEPYTVLDADELAQTTGTRFYREGLHTPGTVLLQPAALMRGLAATLPDNVTVYEDSPITGLSSAASSPRLESLDGALQAEKLLVTNNAFAAGLGFLRGRLIPIFTYASMTRPMTAEEQNALGGAPSWGLIPAHRMGTTVRRLRNNRLLIRNTFTYNPGFTTSAATKERIRRRHEQSLRRRFPMLPELTFGYTWGGALCLSRNASPYFGELAPGIFAAVCHNGVGLAPGTIAGKLLAEHACGEDNELVRTMLSFAEPSIRWNQWRAGREL